MLRDGKLEAIVGVMATHKIEGESLASRLGCVGGDNVWEVEAMGVLRQQKGLSLTTDTIHVPSLLKLEDCAECAQESWEAHERREKQMAVEKLESEERRRRFEESRRKSDQKKQEDEEKRQQADTTVVIIDDNTLRRKGVLMKKFFLKPGDSIDRSYGWMKAPEASP